MLKTMKVKKKLRLDELIKYVWDEDFSVRGYTVFRSDCDKFEVRVSTHMLDYVWDNTSKFSNVPRHATFTVEVEEEITKDTRFKGVQEIYIDAEGVLEVEHHPILARKSLNDVLEEHDEETECLYIYAAVDGKTELIWEAE